MEGAPLIVWLKMHVSVVFIPSCPAWFYIFIHTDLRLMNLISSILKRLFFFIVGLNYFSQTEFPVNCCLDMNELYGHVWPVQYSG